MSVSLFSLHYISDAACSHKWESTSAVNLCCLYSSSVCAGLHSFPSEWQEFPPSQIPPSQRIRRQHIPLMSSFFPPNSISTHLLICSFLNARYLKVKGSYCKFEIACCHLKINVLHNEQCQLGHPIGYNTDKDIYVYIILFLKINCFLFNSVSSSSRKLKKHFSAFPKLSVAFNIPSLQPR